MAAVCLTILAVPLVVALMLSADAPTRRLGRAIAPFTAIPMVLVALLWPGDVIEAVPGWMFGGVLGLDETARLFLLFTALLWSIAAFYAQTYMHGDPAVDRFWLFFMVTMAGNLGLIVSFDIASFYLFFAMMTFAAFGLVVHVDKPFNHTAGKVYLAMAILGEAVLLTGLIYLAHGLPDWSAIDMPDAVVHLGNVNLVTSLLFVGFGVKAGVLLLHMWLPLAHPAAPTPASAVLSGAMIKAGLLGWLRFMPGGVIAMETLGAIVVALGIAAAFYGVIVGIVQKHPKVNLAYSSISQMGFMTVGVGIALMQPALWPTLGVIVGFYALHHAMAKGALFLGVGVSQYAAAGRWRGYGLYLGMGIAALSLAGAPMTSGFLAKAQIKQLAYDMPAGWQQTLDVLLPLAAVGTTLLMGRLLWLVRLERARPHGHKPELWITWGLLLAVVVAVSWVIPWYAQFRLAQPMTLEAATMWVASWPIGLGVLILLAVHRWSPGVWGRLTIPPGDVLVMAQWLLRQMARAWGQVIVPATTRLEQWFRQLRNRVLLKTARTMSAGEMILLRWGAGGVIFLLLVMWFIVIAMMV